MIRALSNDTEAKVVLFFHAGLLIVYCGLWWLTEIATEGDRMKLTLVSWDRFPFPLHREISEELEDSGRIVWEIHPYSSGNPSQYDKKAPAIAIEMSCQTAWGMIFSAMIFTDKMNGSRIEIEAVIENFAGNTLWVKEE